jgi:hypothetical protein
MPGPGDLEKVEAWKKEAEEAHLEQIKEQKAKS